MKLDIDLILDNLLGYNRANVEVKVDAGWTYLAYSGNFLDLGSTFMSLGQPAGIEAPFYLPQSPEAQYFGVLVMANSGKSRLSKGLLYKWDVANPAVPLNGWSVFRDPEGFLIEKN